MKRLFKKYNRPFNWMLLFWFTFLFFTIWLAHNKAINEYDNTRKPINWDKQKDTVTFDILHSQIVNLKNAE